MKDIIITSMDSRIKNIINDLPRNGDFSLRPIDGITGISVHHSASKMGQFDVYDFAKWHTDPNGRMAAPAICYHFCIEPDGEILQVNLLEQRAWHSGNANTTTIGIELNGNFCIEQPTEEQIKSLNWLNDYLQHRLERKLTIKGHKEWKGNYTSCPGKHLMEILIKNR